MTWFKVDDGFYDHPKVDQLSNAAVGLWTKAGSWCGKHETDGVIPATRVRALRGTSAQVQALIDADLWVETSTETGAKAYAFCDWFDYQPSREQREKERQEWAEKKRKARERKQREQAQRENVPQGVPAMSPEGTSRGVPQMSGTSPDPTRPDPTRPDQLKEGGKVVREGTGGERGSAPPSLIPDEWLGNPRLARCAAHAGIDDPPPCVGCRDARRSAEEAGHARAREQMGRAAAAKAERDACDLCDPAGFILGVDEAIRCTHDPDRNGEAVLAADTARREREAADKRARDAAKAAADARARRKRDPHPEPQEAPRGPF